MGVAQGCDSQRKHLVDVIGTGWENEYQPKNISLASIEPRWGHRIAPSDEAALRLEFYKCATYVDETWFTNGTRAERLLLVSAKGLSGESVQASAPADARLQRPWHPACFAFWQTSRCENSRSFRLRS